MKHEEFFNFLISNSQFPAPFWLTLAQFESLKIPVGNVFPNPKSTIQKSKWYGSQFPTLNIMKLTHLRRNLPQVSSQIFETLLEIGSAWRRQKLPLYLFLGLCFNLVLAPVVLATTAGNLSRPQAYWLAALGLVTVALAVYLFFVMFVPEKF